MVSGQIGQVRPFAHLTHFFKKSVQKTRWEPHPKPALRSPAPETLPSELSLQTQKSHGGAEGVLTHGGAEDVLTKYQDVHLSTSVFPLAMSHQGTH